MPKAKVFYYRVRYLKGAVKLTPEFSDYAWVTYVVGALALLQLGGGRWV